MRHPRERPQDRREFLLRSGGTVAGLSSLGALLAACGGASGEEAAPPSPPAPPAAEPPPPPASEPAPPPTEAPPAEPTPPPEDSPFPLARPDNPVTLPIFDDAPPIASGLAPESGPLRIYNWTDYIWKRKLREFGERYGVEVELSTFYTIDEATAKLATGSVDFDVFFPTPDRLARLVYGKLLQPLNHDYLPNLANMWPSLGSPFYDQGAQYTVPYTIYTTGIGYNATKVAQPPGELANPYDVFWDEAYKGQVWVLDDSREAPAMALLRNGISNVNTEDPAEIEVAKADLLDLISTVNVKASVEDYTKISEGAAWIHQAWSGSMIAAQWYLAGGVKLEDLAFWFPTTGGGVIGNDMMAILRTAKNPVLAHLFLDFMLEEDNAYGNFVNFNGYQPPLNSIEPDALVADGVVPENLATAVVREQDFLGSDALLELSPDGQVLWQNAWAEFKAGV